MRVGVARYNKRFDRKNEILVGDYTSVNDLRNKLRKIPYNGGGKWKNFNIVPLL